MSQGQTPNIKSCYVEFLTKELGVNKVSELGNDIKKDRHFLIRQDKFAKIWCVYNSFFKNGIRDLISKYCLLEPNEELFKGYSSQVAQSILICLVKV